MVELDLKLGFADNRQAAGFLSLLGYLEWCGNVGHSTSVTVHADGDGNFRMDCRVCDPRDSTYKKLSEMMPMLNEAYYDEMRKGHRDFQSHKNPERRDRNEIAFCIGD